MNHIYIVVAILAGIVFALQPAVNENVARSLNHPIQASLISFSVGTIRVNEKRCGSYKNKEVMSFE